MIDLELPNCLSLPIPYLLQKHSLTALKEHKDLQGFGLLDWAVCQCDIEKINELKEANFSFNQHTINNKIPKNLFKGLNKEYVIFFSKGGLTPIHLLVFLYKKYDSIGSNIKGQFSIETNKQKLLSFFKSLNNEDFSLKDYSNLSVTDYCFILENIKLINLISKKDPLFLSLNNIRVNTAYDIIKNYDKFKNKDKLDLSIISNNLKTRLEKENLDNKLYYKKTQKRIEKI